MFVTRRRQRPNLVADLARGIVDRIWIWNCFGIICGNGLYVLLNRDVPDRSA
jgi:hypothetical protein